MNTHAGTPLPSTKPYLLRALWEWCNDNGLTPYIVVQVDASCLVPREFVRDRQIVLNIGGEATQALRMDNDLVHFKARFGGVTREVMVPVARVAAIYARENGQGMSFEVEDHADAPVPDSPPEPPAPKKPGGGGMRIVK
ncbi:MAG: ClpXP protease specificity-enhancing factor [Zoogloeaceae bacterium]|jgi:stringent starvation protein B|nr:ClpXP protease specificity-enhancing factor [Zoogloeaceae bacterium]